MVKVAPHFTSRRMLNDYIGKYYRKLNDRSSHLRNDNFAVAREIAAWKADMERRWDEIELLQYESQDLNEKVYHSGHTYASEIILDIKDIPAEYVGVEFVVTRMNKSGEYEFVMRKEFELISVRKGRAIFRIEVLPEKAGAFFYGVRIYARHPELPHRQDFSLLRWVE